MLFIYTTCKNAVEARRISTLLLKRRLCACTNAFPIHGRYWWRGKIVHAREYGLLIKTTPSQFRNVQKAIKSIHSYTTPCIVAWQVKANDAFATWVEGSVR